MLVSGGLLHEAQTCEWVGGRGCGEAWWSVVLSKSGKMLDLSRER